jgi:hypothetical protein|tara:strand:- start:4517 stop:4753 length:237 start_codon:yes stop_codon:yes gene_type:complete
MKLDKFISIPVFLITLAISLFFVYISMPNKKTIYVYPTPENINSFLWQDGTGTCFGWEATQVNKPKDTTKIKTIPVQN